MASSTSAQSSPQSQSIFTFHAGFTSFSTPRRRPGVARFSIHLSRRRASIRPRTALSNTMAKKRQRNRRRNKAPADPNAPKPVCKFFKRGECKFGDKCKFSHELPPEECVPAPPAAPAAEAPPAEPAAAEKADETVEKDAVEAAREGATTPPAEAPAATDPTATATSNGDSTPAKAEPKEKEDQKPQASTPKTEPPAPASKSTPKAEEKKSTTPRNNSGGDGPVSRLLNFVSSPFSAGKKKLPPGLESSLPLLTESQRDLAKKLCELPGAASQSHLFDRWEDDPAYDDRKRAAMAKLASVDESYPDGGLIGYLSNATKLLERSRRGENPLEGWAPSVPRGEAFDDAGAPAFLEAEERGLNEVGKCGFVLVAGGLGERLGYGDIKIGLPTELATGTLYIQFYIETILAFQSRYAAPGVKLPLCIMTSGDTNDKTVALLKKHDYFGMDEDQITIGKGVPALFDNDAHIALAPDDPNDVQMKPHGHGDIHALLHSHGVAKAWLEGGIKWTVFFQDTNGLAFHTLALSLGVSAKLGLVMNSIACPRKAKQAIGAITKLTKGGEERTINVEYNQLDPLLRANGHDDGDVNDPATGLSPYPGNINQLLFDLEAPGAHTGSHAQDSLQEAHAARVHDAELPHVLEGDEAARAGFTSLSAKMCFSPVKNAAADGVALQAKGTHPSVVASGEADQSGVAWRILRSVGCEVEEGETTTFARIVVSSGRWSS
ncbi:hypothetical protein ACHAWF_014902 [Thalassiosira exigua]